MVNVVVPSRRSAGGALGHVRRCRSRRAGGAGRDARDAARRGRQHHGPRARQHPEWPGATYPHDQFRATPASSTGRRCSATGRWPTCSGRGRRSPSSASTARRSSARRPRSRRGGGPAQPAHPPGADPARRGRLRTSSSSVPPGGPRERRDGGAGSPFLAETGGPAYPAIAAAMHEAYGRPMATLGQGGSIPLCSLFADSLPGAELILMGVEEPLALIHAPNESVDPTEIAAMALPRRCSCNAMRHLAADPQAAGARMQHAHCRERFRSRAVAACRGVGP